MPSFRILLSSELRIFSLSCVLGFGGGVDDGFVGCGPDGLLSLLSITKN